MERSRVCLAERTGAGFFCGYVRDGKTDYMTMLRRESGETIEDETETTSPCAEAVQAISPISTARVAIDFLKLVKSCEYFEKRSDCGCGVNYCRRDVKTVSLNDCFSCVETRIAD